MALGTFSHVLVLAGANRLSLAQSNSKSFAESGGPSVKRTCGSKSQYVRLAMKVDQTVGNFEAVLAKVAGKGKTKRRLPPFSLLEDLN